MSITAVSITKSTGWRGGTEFFSNVYHYFCSANLSVAQASELIGILRDTEQSLHSPLVTFETGRAWEVGGTPAENETIVIDDLSGAGIGGNSGGMFKESTVVVRIDTARNTSTGKRIYLRKYYHTCGLTSATASMYEGNAALTTTQTGIHKSNVEALRELSLTGGITVFMCAPGGQLVNDSRPVSVLPYLHTRQFRR